jgi:hypothetical protein
MPKLRAALGDVMRQFQLTPDNVLTAFGQVARADFGDFLDPDGNIDIAAVKANGHLVKSLERKEFGYKLELHDKMRALENAAKALKMNGENVQNQFLVQFNVAVTGETGEVV